MAAREGGRRGAPPSGGGGVGAGCATRAPSENSRGGRFRSGARLGRFGLSRARRSGGGRSVEPRQTSASIGPRVRGEIGSLGGGKTCSLLAPSLTLSFSHALLDISLSLVVGWAGHLGLRGSGHVGSRGSSARAFRVSLRRVSPSYRRTVSRVSLRFTVRRRFRASSGGSCGRQSASHSHSWLLRVLGQQRWGRSVRMEVGACHRANGDTSLGRKLAHTRFDLCAR